MIRFGAFFRPGHSAAAMAARNARVLHGAVLAMVAGIAMGALVGCEMPAFNYYNPLDPQEDAPVSVLLPFVADPTLQSLMNGVMSSNSIETKREFTSFVATNPGGSFGTLDGLEFFQSLTTLGFEGADANEVQIAGLDFTPAGKISGLETFGLVYSNVDAPTLQSLPVWPSLTTLILTGTTNIITDAAELNPYLANYAVAQLSLTLNNAELDPNTLGSLDFSRLNTLSYRSFLGNLADLTLLPANTTVTNLDLSSPGLLSIIGLENFSAIETLIIQGTSVELGTVGNGPANIAVLESLTSLTSLSLRESAFLTTLPFTNPPPLRQLDISSSTFFADAATEAALGSLSDLETFAAALGPVGQPTFQTIDWIAGLQNLQTLSLNGAAITSPDFSVLLDPGLAPSLSSINLTGTTFNGLPGTPLTPADIDAIRAARPNATVLGP